ncbi:hypothetical protein ACIBHX_46615 [Nonomuraea sp. NPDC050536]|uniref:hypothetical protein n=1 Tax=Nonomuraea sp. NPDC050536 TaxID=3364366 RepID=UPI0037C9BDF3
MDQNTSLATTAGQIERAHFTVGHVAYRQHQEHWKSLGCGLAILIAEDAQHTGRWLRSRERGVGWWKRLFLGFRAASHGRNISKAVTEAVKDIVLMANDHDEYMTLERMAGQKSSPLGRPDRYRTGG